MQRNQYIVFGLGTTGLSCVEYLVKSGYQVMVTDSRTAPPSLSHLQAQYPQVPFLTGPWNIEQFPSDAYFLVSPGLDLRQPIFNIAKNEQRLLGDISLFAQKAQSPIVGITGSNGKSTVTTMVGHIAHKLGLVVGVGGNLGTPALSLLFQEPKPDYFILELSSFQLDLCESLPLHTACNLNVTPDHLDRYDDFAHYQASKHSIYRQAKHWVVNLDAPESMPTSIPKTAITFSVTTDSIAHFGIRLKDNEKWLYQDTKPLMPVSKLPNTQKHVISNALAAIAISTTLGLSAEEAAHALIDYQLLPHRCHVIGRYADRIWINDSKATNTGAVIAALNSLKESYPNPVVILGGAHKEESYQILAPVLEAAQAVILYGQAGPIIDRDLRTTTLSVPIHLCSKLEEAVLLARNLSRPDTAVILSPACASFDQHRNYAHRGDMFTQLVQNLT